MTMNEGTGVASALVLSVCIRVHPWFQFLVWRPRLRDRPHSCYKRAMNREDIIAPLRENEAALRARGVLP